MTDAVAEHVGQVGQVHRAGGSDALVAQGAQGSCAKGGRHAGGHPRHAGALMGLPGIGDCARAR